MLTLSLFSSLPNSVRGLFILSVILFATIIFSSCVVVKNQEYFRTLSKDTTLKGFVTNDFESKIQKKDALAINISSLSKEEDIKFNGAASATGYNIGISPSNVSYLVNDQGNIYMHQIGAIGAEGLTRKELKEKLQKALLPYLKDPIVTVQYLNHKVTVLGEVNRPQILNMPDEQMSLLDVIVSCGDLTQTSRRDNVMIIRETGAEKKIKHINLQDHSVFSSPWYYVQPNDIVYVLPDNEKYIKDEKRKSLQNNLALIASGLSLVVIVLNTLLKK